MNQQVLQAKKETVAKITKDLQSAGSLTVVSYQGLTVAEMQELRKALEGGVYRPVMEEWSQFYTILGREMKLMIEDKKSVPQGLEDAQRDLEEMLKK